MWPERTEWRHLWDVAESTSLSLTWLPLFRFTASATFESPFVGRRQRQQVDYQAFHECRHQISWHKMADTYRCFRCWISWQTGISILEPINCEHNNFPLLLSHCFLPLPPLFVLCWPICILSILPCLSGLQSSSALFHCFNLSSLTQCRAACKKSHRGCRAAEQRAISRRQLEVFNAVAGRCQLAQTQSCQNAQANVWNERTISSPGRNY